MESIRLRNNLFVALRAIGCLMFLLFSLAPLLPESPTHQHKPTDESDMIFLVWSCRFLSLLFGIFFIRAVVGIELGDRVTVRRVIGLKKYDWSQIRRISFETSKGGVYFVPVAEFRSMSLHFDRGRVYVRVTPTQELRVRALLQEHAVSQSR